MSSGWPFGGYPQAEPTPPEDDFVDPRPKYHTKDWRDFWDTVLDSMTPEEVEEMVADHAARAAREALGLPDVELSNSYRDQLEEDEW